MPTYLEYPPFRGAEEIFAPDRDKDAPRNCSIMNTDALL